MRNRRGYLMLEMFFVLSVLGVFALISTRLFYSSFHVLTQSGPQTEPTIRFDAAMKTLRGDVFNSSSTEITNGQTLLIHDPQGEIISWNANSNELLRSTKAEHRSWNIGQPVQFKRDGAVIFVQAVNDPNGALAMASGQNIFGGGGK